MKKPIWFCASIALLLGVSGGANAALTPTATFVRDLGTITDTTGFGNIFNADDLGLTAPFTFTFSDVFKYVPVTGSDTSIAVATTFQVVVRNIMDFTGRLFVGTHTETLAGDLATANADAANFFFPLTAATLCAPSGDGQTCTINMSAATVGGLPHFMHFTGTADGSGDQNSVFGDYAGTITVPLPPAAVLFMSALAGLVGFSRIRRRRKAVTTT